MSSLWSLKRPSSIHGDNQTGVKLMQAVELFGLIAFFDGIIHVVANRLYSGPEHSDDELLGPNCASGWSVRKHLLATLTGLIAIMAMRSYLRRREAFAFFDRLGIPGPKPHLIKGNGDLMRNKSHVPLYVMDKWQTEFGHLYGYYVGLKPYVVVRDLDLVQQVLVRDFHKFVDRPAMGIEIRPVINTLVGLRGKRWKEVRRVISPTFSLRQLRKISLIINRCADILVEVVGKHAAAKTDMDFFGAFQGLTCQVIGECALDTVVDCQRHPEDAFLNSLRQFLKKANNPIIDLAIYFPLIRQILAVICRVASPCGQFTQSIIDNVQRVIDARRLARQQGAGIDHKDILQLLLDAADDRLNEQPDGERDELAADDHVSSIRRQRLLTDDEIIANAWVFLLGGFETTANGLTYCAYLIAKHPEIQEKLYQELVDHFPDGLSDELNYEEVSQLSYMDQVFSEALRMYPPVVLFVNRETAEDAQLGQFKLPAGTNVQIPIWQIHHDPDLWPDPFRFDPDRFLPEMRHDRHPMAWIPFGAGPRACMGVRFAMLEAKIALAKLITNYRLLPSERTEENLGLAVPTVTLNPESGTVYLKAEPRQQPIC